MSTHTLVSVIIPVYNAEFFLDRCIKSVINQSYSNWELLLIDDGSPDNCPSMCDEWAQKDDRIRVFHKGNRGPSSARNVGLEQMTGKYVTFLDSDDCLVPECIEKCLLEITSYKLDIVQFYFVEFFTNGQIIHHNNRVNSDVCRPEEYIKKNILLGCSCGGMYNADIIRNNSIKYNEKLHYLEDAFFVSDIVKHSQRLKRISGEYYEYHKNPNGSDKPKDWDYYLDSIEYAAIYKQNNPQFCTLVDGWCTMLAMRYVTLAPKHDYPRFSKAWRVLNVSADFIKSANRRDVVFFDKLQRMVGVRSASKITKLFSKLFYAIKGSK